MSKTLDMMRQEREMRQHVSEAMLALVKRAGRLVVPLEALQDLTQGDSLAIEVVPGEGLIFTYVAPGARFEPSRPEPPPDAG